MERKIRLFLIMTTAIISCSVFVYGDRFFYAMKEHTYKEKAGKIDIVTEKNKDINNLDAYFKNEGSCDVFVRAYVFIYFVGDGNEYDARVLNNSSIVINYRNESEATEDCWYKGNDDYIYYIKPLKVEDRTEKPLVKSIEVNLSDEEKKLIEDKELKVDIVVEGVQVKNSAYKYEWDIDDFNIEHYFDKYINEDSETFKTEEKCNVMVE